MMGPFHAPVHREISAAGPTILVLDRFSGDGVRLDSRPPDIDVIGGGWSQNRSELELNTDRLWADTGFQQNTGWIETGQADVTIKGRIQPDDAAASRRGLAFRTSGANSFLWVGEWNGKLRLGSDSTAFYYDQAFAWNYGSWHDVRIELSGTNVKVYIDEQLEIDVTISEYATVTSHGVMLSRRDVFIDDYEVSIP